jgi:hypothetical protein
MGTLLLFQQEVIYCIHFYDKACVGLKNFCFKMTEYQILLSHTGSQKGSLCRGGLQSAIYQPNAYTLFVTRPHSRA